MYRSIIQMVFWGNKILQSCKCTTCFSLYLLLGKSITLWCSLFYGLITTLEHSSQSPMSHSRVSQGAGVQESLGVGTCIIIFVHFLVFCFGAKQISIRKCLIGLKALWEKWIREVFPFLDRVWIFRPHLASLYLFICRIF